MSDRRPDVLPSRRALSLCKRIEKTFVSEVSRTECVLRLSESELAMALEQSSEAVLITNVKGEVQYINAKFTEVTGYILDDVRGKSPAILSCGKTSASIYEEMWETITSGKVWEGRILNKRKTTLPKRIHGGDPEIESGEYWARLSISPIRNEDGDIAASIAIHNDIENKVAIENQLAYERTEARVRAEISMVLQSNDPLNDRLETSLELITTLAGLKVENKCGIFIRNEDKTHLDMVVLHGSFSDEFVEKEKQIPLGSCLCGRAAVSGELLISDDCFCDSRHEHTFEGMTNHGHYIVPLRAFGETLGVMFLYTAPYPSHSEHRLSTLRSIGDSMAMAIANEQVQQQLINATEAANAGSRAKSEFLANMSHEIRTPLNGILGFADMLRREGDAVSSHERKEWLDVVHSSGQHLLELINDILDLSKIETGDVDLEYTACEPMSMLADLASSMRILAEKKSLVLDIECVGDVPRQITTDPTRLRQILTNLVGNAIKFTHTGSVQVRVCMQWSDETATLVFEVIDTGTGIREDTLESIFDPFSQADTSITRKFGGTGLGLAISRRFAHALGGELKVSSLLGKGSAFTLALPVGTIDALDLMQSGTAEAIRSECRLHTPSVLQQHRMTGHVLLVDDGDTNRQLIELVLRRAGANVTCADNGHKAYALASRTAFDLILMDMQMPIMDGYAATKTIREAGIETPIIALTANAMKEDRDRCIAIGCDEYLSKPVDIDLLLKTAMEWMKTPDAGMADRMIEDPEVPQGEAAELLSSLPMDDPEFCEIVTDYVKTLTERLAQMERLCVAHEFESLATQAHWLLGSGGTAGFDQLTMPAMRLEQCAILREADRASDAIEELVILLDRIQRGLKPIDHASDGSKSE